MANTRYESRKCENLISIIHQCVNDIPRESINVNDAKACPPCNWFRVVECSVMRHRIGQGVVRTSNRQLLLLPVHDMALSLSIVDQR